MNEREYEEYQELKSWEKNRRIAWLGTIVVSLLLLFSSKFMNFSKEEPEEEPVATVETNQGLTEEEMLTVAGRSMGVVLTGEPELDEMAMDHYVESVIVEDVTEEESDGQDVESEEPVYQQNEAYKIYYGTWEVTNVICQHSRLGGDEGYENIIGRQITYSPTIYECNGISIENPEYMMTIFPADTPRSFIDDFIIMGSLLPEEEFYVWVQIVNKPSSGDLEYDEAQYGSESYIGDEFFIKDDNILYCCDYNCVYELTRVSYMEDYDEIDVTTYQERW